MRRTAWALALGLALGLTASVAAQNYQWVQVNGVPTGPSITITQTFTLDGTLTLADTTTSTTGVVLKGANSFIHNFHHPTGDSAIPVGRNTFVGELAGNFTTGSTAAATYNGSYLTAVGYQALQANTTGFDNSAVGYAALYSNTTGYGNSGLGPYVLYANTTGYENSALGYQAGRYITDGSTANATSNTSVYLGADTKALASGDANEIVIGYNATGLGSNTVVLGNTSIVTTRLRGNVGNVDAPGALLHFLGTTEQLRLGYDASNYLSTTINSAGDVVWTPTGNNIEIRNGTNAQRLDLANTFTSATNQETFAVDWQTTANVAIVGTRTAATGTARGLHLGAQTGNNGTFFSSVILQDSRPFVRIGPYTGAQAATSSSSSGDLIRLGEITQTASSGSIATVAIRPTYNQTSGTAANTDLLLNRTQTAVGSGAQYLADLQVGGVSQFSVSTAGVITTASFYHGSVTAGITASTTQTQGQGALTTQINEVSVVANTNDTVTLPAAVAGRSVSIFNNGANTLRIYPASGDNLGAGVDTATTLVAGANVVFQCYDATNCEIP